MIFIYFLALTVGVVLGLCVGRWDVVRDNLFEFDLLEILSFIATIAIATFGAIYLNRKSQHSFKTREIIFESIEEFREAIEELYSISLEYMVSPDERAANKILMLFKSARQRLAVLINICQTCKLDHQFVVSGINHLERLKELLREINRAVTDDPFKQPSKAYTRAQIVNFESAFAAMQKEISFCKARLFG